MASAIRLRRRFEVTGAVNTPGDMPPRQSIIALLAVLLLVASPLVFYLPPWVLGAFLVLVLWTVRRLRRHLGRAPAVIRVLLTLLAAASVYTAYGTIFGRDAGVSLFLLMAGLKLLELNSRRDAMVLLYLGYFLVVPVFLFSQELPMVVYLVVSALALMTVQIGLHRRGERLPWLQLTTAAGSLLLQAAPLVLVLFVLFPRLDGPLWGLPQDAYSGMTGLGESMTPGDISNLARSDVVAFRVRFHGPVPAESKLYWRGPVLGRFDGRTWGFRTAPRQPKPQVEDWQEPVDYSITLEPHNRRWLLALETPGADPAVGSLTVDDELVSAQPVRTRRQYRLTSFLDTVQWGLSPIDVRETTELPGDADPKARALGRSWRGLPPKQRVQRALALFRDQPFRYTLRPQRLDDDAMDEFLFDTREGFCEHYAGAFTFLMRAAGVPARVVTGYQGGEFNPVGDYLLVRQLNAHAWSEVWMEGLGWTRVDPTAVIPPDRVDLPDDTLLARPGLAGLDAPGFLVSGLRALSRSLDALNNRWNEWVLGYGGQQQQRFLESLGLGQLRARTLGLILVGSVVGLLLLVAAWMFWRRTAVDPVPAAYARYCGRLARAGLARGAAEGPWDFYHRVAVQRPALAAQARLITTLYARLRYEGDTDVGHLRHLRRLVRGFHP